MSNLKDIIEKRKTAKTALKLAVENFKIWKFSSNEQFPVQFQSGLKEFTL